MSLPSVNAQVYDLSELPSGSIPAYHHWLNYSGRGFNAVGFHYRPEPGFRTFPRVYDLADRVGHLTDDVSELVEILDKSEQAALSDPRWVSITRTGLNMYLEGGFRATWEGWLWSSDYVNLNYFNNMYWNYSHPTSNRACPEGFTWELYETTPSVREEYYCIPPLDWVDEPRNMGDQCPANVGNPVNAATGNKFEEVYIYDGGDSRLLGLTYSYNSISKNERWTHTFQRSISGKVQRLVAGRDWLRDFSGAKHVWVYVTRPSGKKIAFRNVFDFSTLSTETVNWVGPRDSALQLKSVNGAQGQMMGYELLMPDGSVERYGLSGALLGISYPDGKDITVAYSADGDTQLISDRFGKTLSLAKGEGRLTITTPEHTIYHVTFSGRNLTSVIYPDDTPDDESDNPRRVYHYEDIRFPYHLTGVTDARGNRIATWAYDNQGRAISSEHTDGTDRHSLSFNGDGTTTVTDPLGRQRTYSFTTQHGLIKVASITGGACHTCGADAATFTYDQNGFLASKTDFNGNVTTYVRGGFGQEVSRTEAAGTPQARTVTTEWHPTWRKPTRITEPDRVTEYLYSTTGQIESTRTVPTAP